MKILGFVLTFLILTPLKASPLNPIRVDSPRATMKSYLEAMNGYLENDSSQTRLDDATRTMSLDGIPALVRKERGREAAILLKEVIDRVIIVDLEKVPEDSSLKKWRLKDTEITIKRVESGDREGDFLFSKDTVERIPEFYKKVKELPYLPNSGMGAGYRSPFQMRWMPDWAQEKFWGLKKGQWIGIFLGILLGLVLKTLIEVLMGFLVGLTSKKEGSLRHQILTAIEKPIGLIGATVLWYSAIHFLEFDDLALKLLLGATQITFSISFIWAAYRLTDILTNIFKKIADKTESELDDQLVPLISKSLRVFVIVIGFLVTIQNFGINVMSLLAGLGLGGLAFALAAKDTAANLFGSIMILLDRPFKIGEWINTTKGEGTVEEIGFRSTRVRTFYDSVISIPNSVLANEKIDNMGRRTYRRIYTTLGITYDTPPEKMEAFIEGIRNIIKENPSTRKDYYHVYFSGYGASSLDIMVYFFLHVPDWTMELKEKQNVLMAIYKLADQLGVSFAFPTQSLHIESIPNPLKGLSESFNS